MIAVDLKYNMPMDSTDQVQTRGSSQLNLALVELKDVFCDYFEGLVDDCCYRLEIDFGIHLGQKRAHIEKQAYIDLLQSLKQQKPGIKKSYLQAVSDLFDGGNVAGQAPKITQIVNAQLVEKDASIEEEYILNSIVRKTGHLYLEDINKLNSKIAAWKGKRVIKALENPVCPENLVQALVSVINNLDLKTEYKVALYKVFDEKVFSQLGFVYSALNKITTAPVVTLLKDTKKTKPDEINPAPVINNSEPNKHFQLIQKNLTTWRAKQSDTPYSDMLTSYDETDETYALYEINNALEIIRQFAEYDSADFSPETQPIKWIIKQKLDDIFPDSVTKRFSRDDEDVLDLIAYLFQHIHNERSISDDLKTDLLKLEHPLSELVLSNHGFLFDSNGVGRLLLDSLFDAALFVDEKDHAGVLIKNRIEKLINRIFSDSSCGTDEIKVLLEDFLLFEEKNKKRRNILQQRTVQLVKNKEQLDLSKHIVHREILLSTQGQVIPEKINRFLFDVWRDYLLLIFLRKNDEPEEWVDALSTMKNLVASVNPPQDELQRKKILKLLPALIKELRIGLKRISYDKHSQSAFFKELAVFHVLLMNKNELQGSKSESAVVIPSIDEMVDQYELTEDENYAQIAKLNLGQWLSFDVGASIGWGQLAWKNEETGLHLFTDKQGKKFMEVSLKDLLGYFKMDQVTLIKHFPHPFTQQIFSQL